MSESRPSDIILIRHGESAWNAWGRDRKKLGEAPPEMEGVPDHKTPLTEKGILQATRTGELLAQEFPELAVIYHSPYVRTAQTARTIQGQFPNPPPLYRDLLLVEQQFGRLDAGVAIDRERFLREQIEFDEARRLVGKFYAKPPDGESWFDVCIRTHKFLEKLFRQMWTGKTIGVVSHSVTIATFLYHLAGRDEDMTVEMYKENDLSNCGVVHFRYNPDTSLHWELVCWNRTAY